MMLDTFFWLTEHEDELRMLTLGLALAWMLLSERGARYE